MPVRITPARAVQLYVDYLNLVLNTILTDSRLGRIPRGPNYVIDRYQGGEFKPLELTPQGFLHFRQFVTRVATHIQVESYRYTYSMSADRDDEDAWVYRYEYEREPPSCDVPQAHLHINALAQHGLLLRRSLKRTHFPTMRISVEHLIWHLIEEGGVTPKVPRDEALEKLAFSYSGFMKRRTEIPLARFP